MTFGTLISAADLRALDAAGAPLVVLDCRFDLADTAAGERGYAVGHLPGARYAHLDRDLCGTKTGRNGRHPVPDRATFAATAGAWGVAPGVQVIIYDDQQAMFAAHAWWLLRWLGHDAVAVLDGGLGAWRAAGGALTIDAPAATPGAPYPFVAPLEDTIDADALAARLGRVRLIDARSPERFRGDTEPIDAHAGHIPGARNRFFKLNLDADGRFKSAERLRAEFAPFAVGRAGGPVVHQCGSGVTACHNLLAMRVAGFEGGTLYPGSWSEWCADPARPVAKG